MTAERSRHGRVNFYFRRGSGPRVRLPDDITSQAFKAAYLAVLNDQPLPEPNVRDMPKTPADLRRQSTEAAIKRALKGARTRAAKLGVPFALELDPLLDMAERQDFRCALTGIEFFAGYSGPPCRMNPYLPSLDRHLPALGYVPGNVRLVIFAVNAMLLDWGDDLFFRVANSYRHWRRTKRAPIYPGPSLPAPHPTEVIAMSTTCGDGI